MCSNDKMAEGWAEFDHIISQFLMEQNIPGASVAVSKKGMIIYQQGYGVAGAGRRVHTDSVFRIASISKPVTAAVIIQLCDRMKISLNTKVFGKTGILKSYRARDKRMKKITIRHLLQHSAGWDRDKVGDAVFVRPQIVMKEHPDSQAYNSALLAYALRRKLQFSPGKWHSYSNLGYLVLGEVIEELSGKSFHHVMKSVLQDLDIHNVTVGKRARAHWTDREVEYFNNREPQVVASLYPGEGEVVPQYGGMAMESSGSYGGLVTDTASLLKFVDSMENALIQPEAYEDTDQSKSIISETVCGSAESECQGSEIIEGHDCLRHSAQHEKVNANEGILKVGENVTVNIFGRLDSSTDMDVPGMTSREFEGLTAIKDCKNQSVHENQSEIQFFYNNNNHMNSSTRLLSEDDDVYEVSHLHYEAMKTMSDFKRKNIFPAHGDNIHEYDPHTSSSTVLAAELRKVDESRDTNDNSRCEMVESDANQHSLTSDVHVDKECRACCHQMTSCKLACEKDLETFYISHHSCSRNQESLHLSEKTDGKNLKSLVNSDQVHNILTKPLFTTTIAVECLSRPDYENGCDWYGLGWDVQDNGRSWGHTGGMDGSCGTIFHHKSGLNWAFLLNSWAVDSDLNGVIKYALCSVPMVKMYNQDVLRFEGEEGVRIITSDKSQIICLCVTESAILKTISDNKPNGFLLTWISVMNQDISCVATRLLQEGTSGESLRHRPTKSGKIEKKYIAIFEKSQIKEYFIVFNKTATELKSIINEYKKEHFVVNFLDSFVDSWSNIRYTAVFKHDESVSSSETFVLLEVKAADYVKCVKSYVEFHYVVVAQSVNDIHDELYVSAVLFPNKGCSRRQLQSNNNHNRTHTSCGVVSEGIDVHSHLSPEPTEMCLDMMLHGKPTLEKQHCSINKASSNCSKNVFQEIIKDGNCGHNLTGTGQNVTTTGQNLTTGQYIQTVMQNLAAAASGQNLTTGQNLETTGQYLITAGQNLTTTGHNLATTGQKLENTGQNLTANFLESVKDRSLRQKSTRIFKVSCTKSSSSRRSKSKSSSPNCVYWVQISPESFLTELNRQIKQKNGLVYAKFYTSEKKPFVSGCWLKQSGGNCYHRIAMSKYGLVPELVEAASKNIYLQCLSEYKEEDGTIYYAAIWHAS